MKHTGLGPDAQRILTDLLKRVTVALDQDSHTNIALVTKPICQVVGPTGIYLFFGHPLNIIHKVFTHRLRSTVTYPSVTATPLPTPVQRNNEP